MCAVLPSPSRRQHPDVHPLIESPGRRLAPTVKAPRSLIVQARSALRDVGGQGVHCRMLVTGSGLYDPLIRARGDRTYRMVPADRGRACVLRVKQTPAEFRSGGPSVTPCRLRLYPFRKCRSQTLTGLPPTRRPARSKKPCLSARWQHSGRVQMARRVLPGVRTPSTLAR